MKNGFDLLNDFCRNKNTGNIAIGQDYAATSPIRQKILRENFILGIICWLIFKFFPTAEEMKEIESDKMEEILQEFFSYDDNPFDLIARPDHEFHLKTEEITLFKKKGHI